MKLRSANNPIFDDLSSYPFNCQVKATVFINCIQRRLFSHLGHDAWNLLAYYSNYLLFLYLFVGSLQFLTLLPLTLTLQSKVKSAVDLLTAFEIMLWIGYFSIVMRRGGFFIDFEFVHYSFISFLIIEDANVVVCCRG